MNVLLDSHALIWSLDNPSLLPHSVAKILEDSDNVLHVSIVSLWEIGIKVGNNRLPLSMAFDDWTNLAIGSLNLQIISTNVAHVMRLTTLPFHHRDPFDRMLAAQSLADGIPLVSADAVFDKYGVQRFWN